MFTIQGQGTRSGLYESRIMKLEVLTKSWPTYTQSGNTHFSFTLRIIHVSNVVYEAQKAVEVKKHKMCWFQRGWSLMSLYNREIWTFPFVWKCLVPGRVETARDLLLPFQLQGSLFVRWQCVFTCQWIWKDSRHTQPRWRNKRSWTTMLSAHSRCFIFCGHQTWPQIFPFICRLHMKTERGSMCLSKLWHNEGLPSPAQDHEKYLQVISYGLNIDWRL